MSYEELLNERKDWYNNIKRIHCPCINEDVIFNSKGFHHIKYDGSGRARSKKERMYRLGILPLAIPVIKCATKIHEYIPPKELNKLEKPVEYWALREKAGKQSTTITVILRRIGSGNITFYNIMKKMIKNKKITKNSDSFVVPTFGLWNSLAEQSLRFMSTPRL